MPIKNEFTQWLERAYVRWMAQSDKFRPQREFAKYLNLDPVQLSHYINGRRLPTGKNIKKIAGQLGPEVYDQLGLVRPDPQEKTLLMLFWQMDSTQQTNLLARARALSQEPKNTE